MPIRSISTALLLCLALIAAALPARADVSVRGAVGLGDYPDFGLHFFSRDLSVDYAGGNDAVIELQAYALSFYEPVAPWLKLGFVGGRLDATQGGRPATAGMNLGGYFIALSAKSEWQPFERLGLRGTASLGYADVDGVTTAQDTGLNWNELNFGAEAWLALVPELRLMAGAGWTRIEGEERSFGTLTANSDFEIEGAVSRRYGVEFVVDRNGYVGLTFEDGDREGFLIYFQRAFR